MEKKLEENIRSKEISNINAVTEVRKDVDLVQGCGRRDEGVQRTKRSWKGMRWVGGNPLATPQDSERFLGTPDAGQLQR